SVAPYHARFRETSRAAKGLRVRGLAVGSPQLSWAHFKLAAKQGLVRLRGGLERDVVCSRGVRSSSGRPVRRLGTVARRAGGGASLAAKTGQPSCPVMLEPGLA